MSYQDVIILGAGASFPYGFPTGKGLREMILQEFDVERQKEDILEEREAGGFGASLDSVFNVEDIYPFDLENVIDFHDAFWRSQTYSIDAFIERRKDEFLEIGKYAIAHCLAKCESILRLLNGGGWYQAFLNRVLPNGSTRVRDYTVITFNYDRSLQHYLRSALMNALGPSHYRDGVESSVNIRRLHGGFPLLDDATYGEVDAERYGEFAASIKFPFELCERDLKHGVFEEAREDLRDALRVFVLGFGFDAINTTRLFGELHLNDKEVYATNCGLGRIAKERAERAFGKSDMWFGDGESAMEELISDML